MDGTASPYTDGMNMNLPFVLAGLRSLDPTATLDALRTWSDTASYHDAAELVRSCPAGDRPVLSSALSDVMCGYPAVLYGAPVLIQARSEKTWLALPMPDSMPVEGVTGCRWMSLTHMRPPAPGILTGRPQVAILLMRSAEPEAPAIPDPWLSGLFSAWPAGTTAYVSARVCLPWLAAIECAMVLKANAHLENPSGEIKGSFLSDHAHAWAVDAGRQFREFAAV